MGISIKKGVVYVDEKNRTYVKRHSVLLIIIGLFYLVGSISLFLLGSMTIGIVLLCMFFIYVVVGIVLLNLIKVKSS